MPIFTEGEEKVRRSVNITLRQKDWDYIKEVANNEIGTERISVFVVFCINKYIRSLPKAKQVSQDSPSFSNEQIALAVKRANKK